LVLLASPLVVLGWGQFLLAQAVLALPALIHAGEATVLPVDGGCGDVVFGGFLLAAVLPALVFFLLVLTRPGGAALAALRGLGVLLLAGVAFVLTHAVVPLVLSFELLLLAAIYLLQLTSKSERVLEAALEMFL
jgi:hypothetical protein